MKEWKGKPGRRARAKSREQNEAASYQDIHKLKPVQNEAEDEDIER